LQEESEREKLLQNAQVARKETQSKVSLITIICCLFASHSIEEINEKKSKPGSKEHTKATFQIWTAFFYILVEYNCYSGFTGNMNLYPL
jgi:hypothetical protein